MRRWTIAISAVALCVAAPALAEHCQVPDLDGAPSYAIDEMQSRNPTLFVTRGDQLAIACEPLNSATTMDVRVVMQLQPTIGDLEMGFKKVLATDQVVDNGAVHVRVPDMPELANQTVHVQVYVMGTGGEKSCDAGSIRVV